MSKLNCERDCRRCQGLGAWLGWNICEACDGTGVCHHCEDHEMIAS